MGKRTIIYTVETVVEFGDEADWKMKAREVRTTIKQIINQNSKMKIKKIDSKVV